MDVLLWCLEWLFNLNFHSGIIKLYMDVLSWFLVWLFNLNFHGGILITLHGHILSWFRMWLFSLNFHSGIIRTLHRRTFMVSGVALQLDLPWLHINFAWTYCHGFLMWLCNLNFLRGMFTLHVHNLMISTKILQLQFPQWHFYFTQIYSNASPAAFQLELLLVVFLVSTNARSFHC